MRIMTANPQRLTRKPSWCFTFSWLITRLLLSLYPFNRLQVAEAIVCNSQFCPNYDHSRCRAIFECDFGVCYDKYVFDRSSAKVRYVESGCSTEFQPSVIGKCVGDAKQGYTCACDETSYCNYNHRQLEEADSHRRASNFPLRHLSCLYSSDRSVCYQYGFYSSPCNVSGRSYCAVEKTAGGDFVHEGSVDYVGYFERAAALSANPGEWLCEELDYGRRWRCTCRSNQCSSNPVSEAAIARKIDRSIASVQCREFDSTLKDDGSSRNRTCYGHVCYAEYERTVMPLATLDDSESERQDAEIKVKDVRLMLGCRNFSRPELFYGWAYNKAYGHKQKGQMFCRANMCNDLTVQHFINASFRLEASAARSSTITLFNMASTMLVLCLTALLSLSSG